MWSLRLWKGVAERAVKTFAQALVATVAVGTPLLDVDWQTAAGVAATAAVLSVLTSVASTAVGARDDASLVERGGGSTGGV